MSRVSTRAPLRVAILGASHWHLPNYLGTLGNRADIRLVGISDPDPAVALRLGAHIGCEHDVDVLAIRAQRIHEIGTQCCDRGGMPVEIRRRSEVRLLVWQPFARLAALRQRVLTERPE